MKQILLFLLTFLVLTINMFAYPISPRPLRQLVTESEFIIVGYVVKTYEKKKEKDSWSSKVAKIAVLENLQGSLETDTIEIEFNPNMICPTPDRYFDSTYVISFIDKDKQRGNYQTHALNYGAKTLKKEEIEVYKKRIAEIQQILKIIDDTLRFDKTVEWLLKCAENQVTRNEGVTELSFLSSFWSNHFCNENSFLKEGVTEEKSRNFLSIEQKIRYKKVLLRSIEVPEFNAIDLIYKENESDVDKFLLDKFKNIKEEHYWLAIEFMKRLKHKTEPAKYSDLLEKFNALQFEKNKTNELKQLIDAFISLIE